MRFGLVGTGHWARVTHAPGIAAAQDAELVGVWGRRPEAAREIADAQHARAYDDFDALLGDVDAVAFAVPPDVQAPLAVKAAQAGKHLLLEKPIALSSSESDTLTDAVATSGVASIVFFTTLFQPEVRQWLAWVDGPSDWEGATAHWLGNAFDEGSPYTGSTWRREKGGLWDVGPHTVSMLMTTLGPIDRVTAESGPHDTTALLLHHVSGATSVATLAIDAPAAATVHDLVLWGPRGRSWMPAWDVDPRDALTEAVQQLAGMARSGQVEHPCDVRHGRDVVDVLIQASDQLRDAHEQQGHSTGRHARS